jgi:hypothetical protein
MVERLRIADLPPIFSAPEFGDVLLAMLDIAERDAQRVAEFGDHGHPVTLIGWTVLLHIVVVEVAQKRGTRLNKLVETKIAPRRTIRDTVARLEEMELICRDSHGIYHPAAAVADRIAEDTPVRLGQIRRLHEAWLRFTLASHAKR